MTDKCSPYAKTLKNKINSQSCYDIKALKKIITAWNKSNPKDKIIKGNKDYNQLYKELKSKFNNTEEDNWFDQKGLNLITNRKLINKIQNKYFKPKAPNSWASNKNEWLSTDDIDKVLMRYEDKYPSFKSYGAVPIDFDLKENGNCAVSDLCSINMKQLIKEKKQYIGIVFNLDKHNESGSHWIALFINIPKREINFWDSVGTNPPNEVSKLINKLKLQLHKLNIKKIKIQINKVRHQYKNSECGVYSIYFITQQLDKKRSFTEICNRIVNDDKMNAMRKQYFILPTKTKKNKSMFNFF